MGTEGLEILHAPTLSPPRQKRGWDAPPALKKLLEMGTIVPGRLTQQEQMHHQILPCYPHSGSQKHLRNTQPEDLNPTAHMHLEARVEEAASNLRFALGQAKAMTARSRGRSVSSDPLLLPRVARSPSITFDPSKEHEAQQVRDELRHQWQDVLKGAAAVEATRSVNSQRVQELRHELNQLQQAVASEQQRQQSYDAETLESCPSSAPASTTPATQPPASELASLRKDMLSSSREAADSAKKIAELQQEVADLKKHQSGSKEQVQGNTDENRLAEDVRRLSLENSRLAQEVQRERRKQQLSGKERDSELERLTEKNSRLTVRLQEVENANQAKEAKEAKEALRQLTLENSRLAKELQTAQQGRLGLEEQRAEYASVLEEKVREADARHTQQMEGLRRRLKDAEEERDYLLIAADKHTGGDTATLLQEKKRLQTELAEAKERETLLRQEVENVGSTAETKVKEELAEAREQLKAAEQIAQKEMILREDREAELAKVNDTLIHQGVEVQLLREKLQEVGPGGDTVDLLTSLQCSVDEAERRAEAAEARAVQADSIADDAGTTAAAARRELRETESQLDEALKEIQDLAGRIEELEAELRDKSSCTVQGEEIIKALEQQGEQLRRQLKQVESDAQAANALRSTLSFREAELDASQALNEELTAERDKLKAMLASATERADDCAKRKEALEVEGLQKALAEQKAAHKAEIMSLTQQLESARQTVKEMADKSETMENLASKAIKEAKQAREATRSEAKEMLSRIEKENDELKQKVSAQDSKIAMQEGKLEALGDVEGKLRKDLEGKEQQLRELIDRMMDMKDDSQQLCNELKSSNDEKEKHKVETARLQKEVEQLREQAGGEEERSVLLAKVLDLQETNAALQAQNSMLMQGSGEMGEAPPRWDSGVELFATPPHSEAQHQQPMAFKMKQLENKLADVTDMLNTTEQSLREEEGRNGRLEERIQLCLAQLKVAEGERQQGEEGLLAEVEELREEREFLVRQIRELVEQNTTERRDKKDLNARLEQFGWILGQRSSLVREIHKLYKQIYGIDKGDMSTGARRGVVQSYQQALHILNTYLSEVERQHLGMQAIVHPTPPETQPISPRHLLRMLEHSPLSQHKGSLERSPRRDPPPPFRPQQPSPQPTAS